MSFLRHQPVFQPVENSIFQRLWVWRPWRPCPSSKNHHPYNLTPCRAELGCLPVEDPHAKKKRDILHKSAKSLYKKSLDVSHFTDKGGANTNTCTSHFCTRPFFSPQDQVSTGDCPASEAGKNGVSSVLSLSNYKSPYRNRISWMIARLRHRRLYLLVPSKTLTPVRPFWINMAVMAIMAKRPLFSSVVSFNLRSAGSWQVGSGYLPLNPACLMGILWDPHFML